MSDKIAELQRQLAEAKAGWDSCIADLREAAEICKQGEARVRVLREALETIGECNIHPQCNAARTARSALSSKAPEQPETCPNCGQPWSAHVAHTSDSLLQNCPVTAPEKPVSAVELAPIDFTEVRNCLYCSEKWGFCGYHCDKWNMDYTGKPLRATAPEGGQK